MTAATKALRRSEEATPPFGNRETYPFVLPCDSRGETGGVSQVVEAPDDGIARDGALEPKVLARYAFKLGISELFRKPLAPIER
jgi:hypothetical protein